MLRTHTCGELNITHLKQEVILCGWVKRNRNLGSLTFIDLRDRFGVTQVFCNEETKSQFNVETIGREFVLKVTGKVSERISKNFQISTGEIEILPLNIEILSTSKTPPFTIEDNTDGGEELLAQFRYLDLRREKNQQNLTTRHKAYQSVRTFLSQQNFIEIETPFFIRSTPEGARDFLVPSRLNRGNFYALPQSPQIYKQLLMVGGLDRYFQIVKCFRDEDLRADRQPEFTQIDCEMSFVERADVLNVFEELIKTLFLEVKKIKLETFKVIPYSEAISKYGSDKPDLRYSLEISEITSLVKGKGLKLFDDAEYVGGIIIDAKKYDTSPITRKFIDKLIDYSKSMQVGASSLVFAKIEPNGNIKSSVDKFFDQKTKHCWFEEQGVKTPNSFMFICADKRKKTHTILDAVRRKLATNLNLINPEKFVGVWVIDFPLFELDEETQKLHAVHHPFTAPLLSDISLLDTHPEKARANAYDMVINGVEVGGGSIRIHQSKLQQKIFEILSLSSKQIRNQFGFFIHALQYGTPVHGGIAFGFDRLVSLLVGTNSIRDVIAFPKNNSGKDLMSHAPSSVDKNQLDELNIQCIPE